MERPLITRRQALAMAGALAAAAAVLPAPFALAAGETVDDTDMVLGASDAPVTIIEYSSLTCPHCRNFHLNTLPALKTRYIDLGKARLVYRDFPFDRPALLAAALAHCAGPDHFFGFLEVLFRGQKSWSRAPDPAAALKRIGRLGGLSEAEIDACFADRALLDRILKERLDGAKVFGVDSTPTFIINGRKLVGAQPIDRFTAVIDPLLSGS